MKKLISTVLRNFGLINRFEDRVGLRGFVTVTEIDESGNEREVFSGSNVITNGGRAKVLEALSRPVSSSPILGTLKLGGAGHESGDPQSPLVPSANQTALNDTTGPTVGGPVLEVDPGGTKVTFTFFLNKGDGNGSGFEIYTEAGLYDEEDTLFAYETFPGAYKDATKVLRVDWSLFT